MAAPAGWKEAPGAKGLERGTRSGIGRGVTVGLASGREGGGGLGGGQTKEYILFVIACYFVFVCKVVTCVQCFICH
jgi:hypothetical protein